MVRSWACVGLYAQLDNNTASVRVHIMHALEGSKLQDSESNDL